MASITTGLTPLVSVIMCARNEEEYIGTAIDSILHQTYENLELIVIDDKSTDGTEAVVRSFRDPRIRFYCKHSQPAGLAASKNSGARLSRGVLITYQDADDYSSPKRIELQVREVLSGSGFRIVGCWVEERRGNVGRVWRLPVAHEAIVAGFNRGYNRVTFVSGTMLYPRSVAMQFPPRTKFRYFEDWDQLCRISDSGTVEFRNVPEPLFTYNIRRKGSKGQHLWSLYNVFERACRLRRRAGLEEWDSVEEFEAYLSRTPLQAIRWNGLRYLLQLKTLIYTTRTLFSG